MHETSGKATMIAIKTSQCDVCHDMLPAKVEMRATAASKARKRGTETTSALIMLPNTGRTQVQKVRDMATSDQDVASMNHHPSDESLSVDESIRGSKHV